MIIEQLKAIGINTLFGMFFTIVMNAVSLFFIQSNKHLFQNIVYFIITFLCGLIYIRFIDKIFLSFHFYYLIFIFLGGWLSIHFKYLNINKRYKIFEDILKRVVLFIKNSLLFLINYKLWVALINKIPKKKKNKR